MPFMEQYQVQLGNLGSTVSFPIGVWHGAPAEIEF